MLYSSSQLRDPAIKYIAIQRYLHKFHHKELKKLKLHEKDFLFRTMSLMATCEDEDDEEKTTDEMVNLLHKARAFDLFNIVEAREFVFHDTILLFHDNIFFESPVVGPFGLLSKDEILKYKRFFEHYFPIWEDRLLSGKGAIIYIILIEYKRKIKILNEYRRNHGYGYNYFIKRAKEIVLSCFNIYYRVRYFFEDLGQSYYKFTIDTNVFIFDEFSYVHILSRHYMPQTNGFDIEVSFNEDIAHIDVDNLPLSIEKLIKIYHTYREILKTDEYIIIRFTSSYYILWISFRFHERIKGKCFHVRSFYKIKSQTDLERLAELKELQVSNELYIYV